MLKILIYCLSFFLFVACSCPTDIDTPKTVEPTEFASVLFLNAHPDMDNVSVSLNGKKFIDELKYDNNQVSYKKSILGNLDLVVYNNLSSELVYRSYVSLQKEHFYTLLLYGTNKRMETCYLEDTISAMIASNSYVRIFHLCPDAPDFVVELKDMLGNEMNSFLSYKQYSQLSVIPTGTNEISIYDSAKTRKLINLPTVNFKPGIYYRILLKGYYQNGHRNSFECSIVEMDMKKLLAN